MDGIDPFRDTGLVKAEDVKCMPRSLAAMLEDMRNCGRKTMIRFRQSSWYVCPKDESDEGERRLMRGSTCVVS